MINEVNLINKLLEEVVEFKGSYDKIIRENDGEILSYIIFGELSRFFIKEYNTSVGDKIQSYLIGLLDLKDEKISELVSFGFLENLQQNKNDEEYKDLKDKIRSQLLEELKKIDNWWAR